MTDPQIFARVLRELRHSKNHGQLEVAHKYGLLFLAKVNRIYFDFMKRTFEQVYRAERKKHD